MDLSVIIVNYNVRYFLEQALLSVERAIVGIDTEVWVVDNNSADNSVQMVRERFPWVRLIANIDNPGFSVANNQAIRQSTGRHVLLLNPDTVVEEDTFRRCLSFMEEHPRCGGLGVRMIDGRGQFLPESKRGLPTPWVAFTKAFGLARLFPTSPRFNHYHLGFLAEGKTHEVEILAGAFMWMRKEALDEVGLLDEAFFMYGEDIDLSYRIIKGGWKNYYYPGTSIIHYKGESTKRGSLNYVKVFYQAMIIFAQKHFAGSQGKLLVALMQMAIYLRAAMTIGANLWRTLRFPMLEAIGIYVGLRVLKKLWSVYHFGDPNYFSDELHYLHFPAYTLLWVGSVFLSGGYDRPFVLGRTLRALGIGTILLFAIYGLLPETLRPSRALLLLGAAWATTWILVVRGLGHLFLHGHLRFSDHRDDRLLIVGSPGETERTLSLLQRAGAVRNFLGRIAPGSEEATTDDLVGRADRLDQLADLYRVQEIIFCSADLSNESIQRWMTKLGPERQYQILPEASSSIIGSHRSDAQGTLYTIDVNLRINDPTSRRAKWLFDRSVALGCLILFPVLILLAKDKSGYLANVFGVMFAQESWVGYAGSGSFTEHLPGLLPGVFNPATNSGVVDADTLRHLNFLYARDYSVSEDWRIFINGLFGNN